MSNSSDFARLAKVAMMSSASKPVASIETIFKAASTSLMMSTWPLNSSGVLARLALYSLYRSVRKVCLETSKATARCVGFSSRTKFNSIEVKPYTALVGCPVEVAKVATGSA
ncbi:hypothetical protein GALL_417950 [mine drainage metagenome]|uniref:Uncharacterized protein n=1 Tax=mine drainage metagenome TaxID=410659 RepID=A0A1J5PYI4_9ZZZZ